MTLSTQLPRVLIIDDHPAIRLGISKAIEDAQMTCCGFAGSLAEAMAQIAHTNPDAITIDLNLPDGSGLDLIRWVRKNSQTTAIVMITFSDSHTDLIAAMNAGASGFLKKSAPLPEVISILKRALAAPLSFSAADLVVALRTVATPQLLTQREVEVLRALTHIGDVATLARAMHISVSTFKSHTSSIYKKLGIPNRAGAIAIARETGIIRSP